MTPKPQHGTPAGDVTLEIQKLSRPGCLGMRAGRSPEPATSSALKRSTPSPSTSSTDCWEADGAIHTVTRDTFPTFISMRRTFCYQRDRLEPSASATALRDQESIDAR